MVASNLLAFFRSANGLVSAISFVGKIRKVPSFVQTIKNIRFLPNSFSKHLAQPTRKEMLGVPGLYAFGMKALGQLAQDRIDQIAFAAQLAWLNLFFPLGQSVGRQPKQPMPQSFSFQFRTPVIAIPQYPALNTCGDTFGHFQVIHIGGHQSKIGDHARQTDPQIGPQAQEDLPCHLILTKGRMTSQRTEMISASKATDRNGQAICDRNQRVMVKTLKQNCPQFFLDLPQACHLADKCGPMDLTQGRKPIAVVTPKVVEDATPRIISQKFTYNFHGQDFAILHSRLWPALTKSFIFQEIVYQTENADDKHDVIHFGDHCTLVLAWQLHLNGGLFSLSSSFQNPHIRISNNHEVDLYCFPPQSIYR